MVALNKFFTSVVLVAVCATSGVGAAPPRSVSVKHATHRVRSILNGRGMIETHHPASSLEVCSSKKISFFRSGITDEPSLFLPSFLYFTFTFF
jgi:hypothetical protein